MRRRDFTIGLLLAAATQSVRAQGPPKQRRIAIAITAGPVTRIDDRESHFWYPFWQELRRLGEIEGQNLAVERYAGEGQPEGYADLFREVVSRNPDVIVAHDDIVRAARTATGTIPVVVVGAPIQSGLTTSLPRPGGNITGVDVFAGIEIWSKRLQILTEAIPSASKVALLAMRAWWEGVIGQELRQASQRLKISLLAMPLRGSTPSEYQRVFTEIEEDRPDAILVGGSGELAPYRRLIVELAEKNRLPAMYSDRDYMDAGGLMAYAVDLGELGRRVADDVHQILNGAKPSDIPIYQPTKFELVINLKAAQALGLALPPSLLARADEVIE
jgi:putative ABC transport system substrate-binding protein